MRGYLFMALSLAMAAGACDDGRIYDETSADGGVTSGFTVTMKGSLTGCSDYEDNTKYCVALAAFREGDDFAVVSKPLSDGNGDVALGNIPAEAEVVEVCLINRLRERVFTYVSHPLGDRTERDASFDAGSIDASAFATVQNGIFNASCTQCHGATGHSAAGLDLMPGVSYNILVGKTSSVVEGAVRVVPGDAGASTLWKAVATDFSSGWAFNHSSLLKGKDIDFIENWINSGAND